MSAPLALVLYVVALWWSATGLILYLNRRPTWTFRWTLAGASVVLALALYALYWSRDQATVTGACVGFGASVLVWGWLEVTFLTGAITGPRRHACLADCRGRAHFLHATQAILYHELATLAAMLVVIASCWQAPNTVGAWTILLLWAMRLSAKLNLHFGVPNVAAAMLPPHLHYLLGFFRQSGVTPLLLACIGGIALLCAWMIGEAMDDGGSAFENSARTLLATLATLALLEHVLLALPMRADALWNWTRRPRSLGRLLRRGTPSARPSADSEARCMHVAACSTPPDSKSLCRAAGLGGTL